jgi:alpha-mannosidase
MRFEQTIRGNFMLKHRNITLDRLEKFISSEYFTDVNLYGKLYGERKDVNISVYSVPNGDRISYEEAIKQQYKTTKIGTSFGPSWYTHWFRIEATIPQEWKGKEVHFLWDSDSEALVYQDDIPQQVSFFDFG